MRPRSLGRYAFGQLAPDMPDFENIGVEHAWNLIPVLRGFKPLPTLQATSLTAMSGAALGAISVRDPLDGSVHTYAGDATKLYQLSGTTWTDSTQAGYTHAADGHWSFVQIGRDVIASNGEVGGTPGHDVAQVITVGGTNFADLVTTPADEPRGRFLATVRGFLVHARMREGTNGDTGYFQRVRWSAYRDPTYLQFNAAKMSDFQDLDESGGEITGLTSGELSIVFQEDATWRMLRASGSKIFRFDRVRETVGCIASKSIVRYDNRVYWLSRDGFRALDVRGGEQSEPIGEERVDRTVFDELDLSALDNVTAAAWPEKGCIVWAYPGPGHATGEANRLAIYNFITKRWAFGETAVEILLRLYSAATTLDELTTLYGTLDAVPASLNDPQWAGGTINFGAINGDHQSATFTGTPGTGTIETGETQFGSGRTLVTDVRPLVDAGTVTAQVGYRSRQTDAVTWTPVTSQTADGLCSARAEGRYHRARIAITGEFEDAVGVEPYGGATGQR